MWCCYGKDHLHQGDPYNRSSYGTNIEYTCQNDTMCTQEELLQLSVCQICGLCCPKCIVWCL